MKYAVYGENFGVMRLFEDGFDSEEEAWKWLARRTLTRWPTGRCTDTPPRPLWKEK